jgi:5'-methylthioadenosine phosphorylase
MAGIDVGVMGGSGLYEMMEANVLETVEIETPFGAPSDGITIAEVSGVRVGFLPRHGRGHRLSPSHVPYRANVWALKALGARSIVSITAVGSLREGIAPGHLVVPDQLLDRTKGVRPGSFFDEGLAVHVGFADPYCATLRGLVIEGASDLDLPVHDRGTLVVMEGPQFSTRAESNLYRSFGAHVIGMTALPEAKLAREAQMCYVTLAMATDYDCWHETEDDVTVESVVAVLKKNSANAQRLFARVVGRIGSHTSCTCHRAMQGAVITAPDRIGPELRERYSLLLDGVLP